MTMLVRRLLSRFRGSRSGVSAVEFAILAPVAIAAIHGMMSTVVLVFSISSMNFAVERGARCAAIDTATCSSAADVQAYASAQYYATGEPAFTVATAACGNLISATMTYEMKALVPIASIPLSATACFPDMS